MLAGDSTSGKCIPCDSSCSVCYNTNGTKECLSCAPGFSRVGTICLNDTHLAFNFTIAANSSTILNSIENITLGIEKLLN